jgi:riboflavin synthase
MFTGLVESVGRVAEIQHGSTGVRLAIATALADDLTLGESVAVNGVCLTVVARASDRVHADISPETLRMTTLGDLATGASVNLERALRADARIGGHFVLGHVDGIGTIASIRAEGDSHRVAIDVPASLDPYLVEKGSVAVDGVSLTIAAATTNRFEVQIIPFTWQHTTFSGAAAGGRVNLECDILGKYALKALGGRLRDLEGPRP